MPLNLIALSFCVSVCPSFSLSRARHLSPYPSIPFLFLLSLSNFDFGCVYGLYVCLCGIIGLQHVKQNCLQ